MLVGKNSQKKMSWIKISLMGIFKNENGQSDHGNLKLLESQEWHHNTDLGS